MISLQEIFGDSRVLKVAEKIDWDSHPLGPVENWSTELIIHLSSMSRCPFGMGIYWGEDHVFFYNDVIIDFIGPDQHPSAFGAMGQSIFQPDVWKLIEPDLRAVFKDGKSIFHRDALVPKESKGGVLVDAFFTYSFSPIFCKNGNIGGILVVTTETTEKVAAENAFEEALKTRDDFLSIASHELRTPLTSLLIHQQLYERREAAGEEDFFTKEQQQKIIRTSGRLLSRMKHLVEGMLDVSRIQSHKLSYLFQPTDICLLVEAAVNEIIPHYLEKGATAPILSGGDCSIVIIIDPVRIQQILMNLLENALKYGEGSRVQVRIQSTSTDIYICVEDQGPGIPRNELKNIFDCYGRVQRYSEKPGLGLGLFISREIAHAHRGEITVTSELGQGTEFILRLPK